MKKDLGSQALPINPQPTGPSVLFVVGPTASGKSSLAMKLAYEFDGEIICADSQTIRKELNIGTAKPSAKDQKLVNHYLLDIIGPYDDFSVNEFKVLASKAIEKVRSKGKIPIIVGGSGLYIDALYYDFNLEIKNKNSNYKKKLEKMSAEQLREIIIKEKYELPNNSNNPRHLIGLILREGNINQNVTPVKNSLIYGMMPEKDNLKERINKRIEDMFEMGFVSEVEKLIKNYGRPTKKMDAIGYPLVIEYIDGIKSLEEVKKEFKSGDWQYARRQIAWFKRNKNIRWFSNEVDALRKITKELNQF
jgi:tRNA dimethylallyltransferase